MTPTQDGNWKLIGYGIAAVLLGLSPLFDDEPLVRAALTKRKDVGAANGVVSSSRVDVRDHRLSRDSYHCVVDVTFRDPTSGQSFHLTGQEPNLKAKQRDSEAVGQECALKFGIGDATPVYFWRTDPRVATLHWFYFADGRELLLFFGAVVLLGVFLIGRGVRGIRASNPAYARG